MNACRAVHHSLPLGVPPKARRGYAVNVQICTGSVVPNYANFLRKPAMAASPTLLNTRANAMFMKK